jgi:hypothetical protein
LPVTGIDRHFQTIFIFGKAVCEEVVRHVNAVPPDCSATWLVAYPSFEPHVQIHVVAGGNARGRESACAVIKCARARIFPTRRSVSYSIRGSLKGRHFRGPA